MVMAQDSVVRPANETQYAAGDALSDNATTPTVAGYFTLVLARCIGGGGVLTNFTLHKSDHDVTAAAFELLLFDTVPALAGFDDNAALAITDAEYLRCQGVVPFAADDWANVANGDIQTVSKTVGFVCVAASMTMYGILALAETYTPGSAEKFSLTVHGYQD